LISLYSLVFFSFFSSLARFFFSSPLMFFFGGFYRGRESGIDPALSYYGV
jgi:hypothetical protein